MGCGVRRRRVIVIDTSAVIAILFAEPPAAALIDQMALDTERLMSVASYLEAGNVLASRRRSDRHRAIADLDQFLDEADIRLHPVDVAQARVALRARIEYGRGMGHGGVLNYGDTFSYALAKTLGVPLLFVGDDFGSTDIVAALGSVP